MVESSESPIQSTMQMTKTHQKHDAQSIGGCACLFIYHDLIVLAAWNGMLCVSSQEFFDKTADGTRSGPIPNSFQSRNENGSQN